VRQSGPDTEELLDRSAAGDTLAREELLERHRHKLRRMVAVRLNRRLGRRIDPSDVVQEALTEAAGRLDDYLRDRPMSYYPWLRRLTWDRLDKLQRRHTAGRRNIHREEHHDLPDESAQELANRLLSPDTGPLSSAARREMGQRVRAVLARLSEVDREVLVLRFLERLSTAEAAEVVGVSQGAVRLRLMRALERLRESINGV
jgi:RNA polymerase sigma-70 factor, ECF subfamily